MYMSEQGMNFIIALEGFKKKCYKDSKGLDTIGVGHLIQPGEEHLKTATLSEQEVYDLFEIDLQKYVDCVNNTVEIDLKQYQFDALVSICFNIGKGAFKGSTFLRLLNNNEIDKVPGAILMWNKPSEICGRRNKEANLFESGSYV